MNNPLNWLIVIGIIILLWFLISWYQATVECSENTKRIIELLNKDNSEENNEE